MKATHRERYCQIFHRRGAEIAERDRILSPLPFSLRVSLCPPFIPLCTGGKRGDGYFFIFHFTVPFVFIVALVFLSGCVIGPDDVITLPPADPYHTEIAMAWIEFESGRYNDAAAMFREASATDLLSSDAYLGLAWCYAVMDQMKDSISNFDLAIAKEPGSPDGYAGKAFVHLAQNEYKAAIEAANRAIELGGEEYAFNHIPDVQTRNLRLLLAECYYAIGQYANAQAQIDVLKPDNNLDPNSRNYKRDLLLEIESLKPTGPILTRLAG